jgi:hypothetical protein
LARASAAIETQREMPHRETPERPRLRTGRRVRHVAPARFPIERNRSIEKKSRQIKMLERILVEKVCQLFRNAL